MKKSTLIVPLFCVLTVGCRAKQLAVVHVYRNGISPVARALDQRFLEFNDDKHRLSSGERIVSATYESEDYKQMLRDRVGNELRLDLIVLDSPGDAAIDPFIEQESRRAVDLCDAARACPAVVPAFIPSFVTDAEALEASQVVLKALLNAPPADRLGISR